MVTSSDSNKLSEEKTHSLEFIFFTEKRLALGENTVVVFFLITNNNGRKFCI